MRIVHYLQEIDFAKGGVVRAVLDLATGAHQRGHEVSIVTWNATDAPPEWKDNGPEIIEIERPAGALGLFSKGQLGTIDRHVRSADVLHLHAIWTNANNQWAKLARAAGVPYVVSIHGMLDDWCMAQRPTKKRVYLKLTGNATLAGAAIVHSTAQGEWDQAKKWIPGAGDAGAHKGAVVPLVFDLAPYRDLPGPGLANDAYGPGGTGDIDDRPVVLFLSRIHEKKQPDVFVRMAAELTARGVDATFVIAGTPEDEAYGERIRALAESCAREKGVENRVRFVGLVTGDLKTSLYERADVFALPTSQENFGFVFPEALVCATPVVTTKGVDTWPELVGSGGAVTAEATPEAFADAVEAMLKDDAKRAQMGADGRAWVFSDLDPEVVAERFEQMYERARTGAPAGASA
ncbi:MAG: glycosyltransferase [Planctomycetota bacterium]